MDCFERLEAGTEVVAFGRGAILGFLLRDCFAGEDFTPDKGTATTKEMVGNVFSDKMLNRFDWGLGFRAGTEIARHIQLSIGYDWGMKNINKSGVDNKNRTFVASCAYMF